VSDEHRKVETEFTAKDAGYGAGLAKISRAFSEVHHKLEGMREKIGEFRREQGLTTVAALGLGYGIGSWVEKIKEANAEFSSTQKQIAGVLSGALNFAKGTDELERYQRSLKLSTDITKELNETAGRFTQPLTDVATAYKSIAIAAGGLGLSQKQVMDLTVAATATAKRFGVSGEQAATAISRALQTGAVRGFDPFDSRLRQTLGNMKKLTQAQRFDHIEKALRGSMAIADAMSGGIGGALSQARHAVEGLLRDATGPLFKEIAVSLQAWSKHIHEMTKEGKPMVDMFADKLVKAFHVLQDVSKFIREHWVAIGAVFAGIKAGGMLTSAAGALGGLGETLGGMRALSGLGGAASGLGGMLGTLGAVAPALGGIVTAAGLAAIALHGVYEEWQGRKKQAADLGGFFDEMGKVAQTRQYLRAHEAGLTPDQIEAGKAYAQAHAAAAMEVLKQKNMLEDGVLAMQKFNGVMDAMSDDVRQNFAKKLGMGGLGDVSSSMLGAAAAELLNHTQQAVTRAATPVTDDKSLKFAKQINNFYGGVHVAMKFEDTDLDRVFPRFVSALQNEVSSRTQALTAEPQGD
jgi:hypothetical protein